MQSSLNIHTFYFVYRTYFHREVTPEDRALLGDCAPKLLSRTSSSSVAGTPSRPGSGSVSGSVNTSVKTHSTGGTSVSTPSPHASRVQESLWNTAGTWEERDYSKWGKSRLKSLLEHIVVYLPDKQGKVNVTDVSHIEGDASMIHIRGRNKLIYDFSLHVHWKVCPSVCLHFDYYYVCINDKCLLF